MSMASGQRGWNGQPGGVDPARGGSPGDRKSTRLNSSHSQISYAVFCLKKKNIKHTTGTVRIRTILFVHSRNEHSHVEGQGPYQQVFAATGAICNLDLFVSALDPSCWYV